MAFNVNEVRNHLLLYSYKELVQKFWLSSENLRLQRSIYILKKNKNSELATFVFKKGGTLVVWNFRGLKF